MSKVYEPDRTFSAVISAATADQIKYLIDYVPCLDSSREYLFVPGEGERPFELARGIGVESSGYVLDKMRMIDIEGYVCRWDEVKYGTLRAPSRIPGYVGNVFSFVVTDDRVYLGDPPCIWPKTNTTWEGQAFSNHEHPGIGDALEEEAEYVRDLRADLELCFPDRRFIVEYQPSDRVTFYEPGGDAPTNSESEWEPYIREGGSPVAEMMSGIVDKFKEVGAYVDLCSPNCHICGGRKIADTCESTEYLGVIYAYCESCGKRYVASTRTIRYRVGIWQDREVSK